MNTILLQPTDVLFFRDGRPMAGSLAGHTAAWPFPNVVSAAFHAAMHRAGLETVHVHRRARSGRVLSEDREKDGRKFGALAIAGPFPVRSCEGQNDCWFFPRPADAQAQGSTQVTLRPVAALPGCDSLWTESSLPLPLKYAVGNTAGPAKNNEPEKWVSASGLEAYLKESNGKRTSAPMVAYDSDIADREQQIGITIDPATETAGRGEAEGKIYSAHYLRLRQEWRLGVLATAPDKELGSDLLLELLRQDRHIVIGGQQRICTAQVLANSGGVLPLPKGMRSGFCAKDGKWLVKWALLSPAIWPEIPAQKQDGSPQNAHPGGWLPNWVFVAWDSEGRATADDKRNGRVLLTNGPGVRKALRKNSQSGGPIQAQLVAAIVPKPVVVSGWSLGDDRLGEDGKPGAKSTHLAVPAGAIYYFEADTESDATALADALNWHGSGPGVEIKNRRSTLMGEKGFGLGVCGTWNFFEDVRGHSGK